MEWLATMLSLPILLLIVFVLLPTRCANAQPRIMRWLVTSTVGVQLLLALSLAVAWMGRGEAAPYVRSLFPWSGAVDLGIYYDGVSGLMLLLVGFVGFVVSAFSIRYLDGERAQGQYFRWLAVAIGAVSLMAVTGNLLLMFFAWVMTSMALHHLLLHYRHRPGAHRAAWTKFIISRIGDAFLIVALHLIFITFGTFELTALFACAEDLAAAAESQTAVVAIAWLLMGGAVTKSAQFPFHIWLPDSMETPTPVSAIMHAGIINAGGYLMIRMSPLIAHVPSALATLAVIGTITAFLGGIAMMAQSNVKKTLAYSTVAQMGFMMLQCGLGAFSAAMLHILAHSLYKAYAFLGSGTLSFPTATTRDASLSRPSCRASLPHLLAAACTTFLLCLAVTWAFGLDIFAKPGGPVLAFILCLALTGWSWGLFVHNRYHVMFAGVMGVGGSALAYVVSYLAIDHLLSPATPIVCVAATVPLVAWIAGISHSLLFALHAMLLQRHPPAWLEPLRVHAANDFYLNAVYQRVFASLATS